MYSFPHISAHRKPGSPRKGPQPSGAPKEGLAALANMVNIMMNHPFPPGVSPETLPRSALVFYGWSPMATPQELGSLIHEAESRSMFYVCKSLSLMSCDDVCPSQLIPCAWGLGAAHTPVVFQHVTHQYTDSTCPGGLASFVTVVIMVGSGSLLFYKAHTIIVMLFSQQYQQDQQVENFEKVWKQDPALALTSFITRRKSGKL